jgi:hypothetical protein
MLFNILDEIRDFYRNNDSLTYPNTILLNKSSINELYPQIDKSDINQSMVDKLNNYYGLKVVYTDVPLEPRLLKL